MYNKSKLEARVAINAAAIAYLINKSTRTDILAFLSLFSSARWNLVAELVDVPRSYDWTYKYSMPIADSMLNIGNT